MKKVLKNIYEYIEHKVQILRGKYVLKNKDFTIISNNCWGGNLPTLCIAVYLSDSGINVLC